MFQSRSGFSPCLDLTAREATSTAVSLFQSRSGFSPCLDGAESGVGTAWRQVSIPLWVFSLPRRRRAEASRSLHGVSIPLWVFSLPRHRVVPAGNQLQRVSIPLWVFSLPRPPVTVLSVWYSWSFNPALGFLPASTLWTLGFDDGVSLFQSRSGFSPRLDGREDDERCRGDTFQSRSGFSPRLDARSPASTCSGRSGFNPALGFLPVSTRRLDDAHYRVSDVSIPLWVFSPSRPLDDDVASTAKLMFQSRSGFSPRLDSTSTPRFWRRLPFQSRSGFSPRLDTANRRPATG